MLSDRDYMRDEDQSWLRTVSRWPVALWLVVANVVCFALQQLFPQLERDLALRPAHLLHGQVWELLSFQFLHGGLFHLIINCAMLYMFGRTVETTLGRKRFLLAYFLSGVGGGLFQVAYTVAFRSQHLWLIPVVGASAGVFGLVAAFAMLYRNMPLTMLVAFILPVTIKAKYLLVVEAVIAFLGMLSSRDNVAHAAHLGGMITGVLFVLYLQRRERQGNLASVPTRLRVLEAAEVRRGHKAAGSMQPTNSATVTTEEFLAREVDPILEKISAHGIQSLTERERRILDLARERMKRG
jgi:membrane associated rhomboid family serine protease